MFQWLKNLFSGIIKTFRSFLKQVFTSSTELLLAQIKDFAVEVVTTLGKTDLTDSEKREQAFKDIKEYAINKGLNVKDSLINLAIELTVTYLKNKITG